jgi:hypothetical protein
MKQHSCKYNPMALELCFGDICGRKIGEIPFYMWDVTRNMFMSLEAAQRAVNYIMAELTSNETFLL